VPLIPAVATRGQREATPPWMGRDHPCPPTTGPADLRQRLKFNLLLLTGSPLLVLDVPTVWAPARARYAAPTRLAAYDVKRSAPPTRYGRHRGAVPRCRRPGYRSGRLLRPLIKPAAEDRAIDCRLLAPDPQVARRLTVGTSGSARGNTNSLAMSSPLAEPIIQARGWLIEGQSEPALTVRQPVELSITPKESSRAHKTPPKE
jgi:hypothetical protein